MGKPINISNIEKKIKEEFGSVKDSLERVKDSVNNGRLNDLGTNIQSKSRSFFEALGDIILLLFNVFIKVIGLIFVIASIIGLIGFFISLLTVGVADIFHFPREMTARITRVPHYSVRSKKEKENERSDQNSR